MKNIFKVLALLLVMSLAAPCGAWAQSDVEPVPVILASHMNPGGPENLAMIWMAEQLEERSGGRFAPEVYEGGVLGNEPELMEQVRSEQVHFHFAGSASLDKYVGKYMVGAVPYLIQTQEALAAVYGSKIGDAIDKELAANNFLNRGICMRGNRQLTSNREVKVPEDLQGMKIRLPENAVWMEVWKELGTLPTPISGNETFSALQTGVVEAQENPIAANYQKALWEVQKYTIMTNHVADHFLLIIPKKWYESLVPELRAIVDAVAAEGAQRSTGLANDMANNYRKEMENKGMIFIDNINIAPFVKKAQPAIDRISKGWDGWVYEEAMRILSGF